MRREFGILLSVMFCLGTHAQSSQLQNAKDLLWRNVASSDLIVMGTLLGRMGQRTEIAFVPNAYNRFAIVNPRYLKGQDFEKYTSPLRIGFGHKQALWFQDHISDSVNRSGSARLRLFSALNRQCVMVFLVKAGFDSELYLEHGPGVLIEGTSIKASQVEVEIKREQELLESFAALPAATPDEYHNIVRCILDRFIVKETRSEAFRELEELGTNAVPSMIRLMDDRRELNDGTISLPNKSSFAFEGLRHYRVANVLQAVDAILNQITSENFNPSWNDGPDQAREDRALNAWRIYLIYEAFPARLAGKTD